MFSLSSTVEKGAGTPDSTHCPPADALKFETFHIFQNNVQVRVRADGVNVLHDVLVLPQILIDFGSSRSIGGPAPVPEL